jgi:DMSO reductase anchor subunit
MCHQRLAEGEAPACVQACPTEAIRIVNVRGQKPEARDRKKSLFPPTIHDPRSTIPSSTITLPTTSYIGREVPAAAFAADRAALIPQHAHWPLVFMLVFTQAGIGLISSSTGTYPILLAGTLIFFSGMAASVLHLGQPLKAWRFFLGLRTSWLSREILAFSLFAPVPLVLCALPFLPDFPFKSLGWKITALSVLPLGILAVFTSVMIYHDTRRSLWRFSLGGIRFFGTVASFAALGTLIASPGAGISMAAFTLAVLLMLAPELHFLRQAANDEAAWSPDAHSARIQTGPLANVLRWRIILALAALAAAFIQPWFALPILLGAGILERQLFFQSVQAPKMPGNFGPQHRHH